MHLALLLVRHPHFRGIGEGALGDRLSLFCHSVYIELVACLQRASGSWQPVHVRNGYASSQLKLTWPAKFEFSEVWLGAERVLEEARMLSLLRTKGFGLSSTRFIHTAYHS